MDQLQNQAAAADAELQGGDGVVVGPIIRAPFDVEADDERWSSNGEGFGYPIIYHGW